MNKTDLINEVADVISMTKNDSNTVITAVLDTIIEGLVNDGKVSLSGLGTFTIKERDARIARNPKTGEPVDVPAKKVVKFKASSLLNDDINGE